MPCPPSPCCAPPCRRRTSAGWSNSVGASCCAPPEPNWPARARPAAPCSTSFTWSIPAPGASVPSAPPSGANSAPPSAACAAADYDCALDFQGAIKSALLARLSGAALVLGFRQPRESPARWLYRLSCRNPLRPRHRAEPGAGASRHATDGPFVGHSLTAAGRSPAAQRPRTAKPASAPCWTPAAFRAPPSLSSIPAPDGPPNSGRPRATPSWPSVSPSAACPR